MQWTAPKLPGRGCALARNRSTGYTDGSGIRGDIAGNNASGANHGPSSDAPTRKNTDARAELNAFFQDGTARQIAARGDHAEISDFYIVGDRTIYVDDHMRPQGCVGAG